MSSELYISGNKIDIDASQVVALTRQVSNIAEIQSRQANLSNTFRVRYTENNEKALAFVGRPGNNSTYPYRFLPARLVQNGFEIIRSGNALIKNAGERSAEVTIYWGNNDFFDRLNFSLRELDFSDLNHLYNRLSAQGLNILDSDAFYPYIEYGGNSTYRYDDAGVSYLVQDISKSYPAVKLKRIWDQIFEHIGFNYTGNLSFDRQAIQLTTRRGQIDDKTPFLVSSRNTTVGTGTFFRWLHSDILVGDDSYFPRSGIANPTRFFVNATGFKARFKFRIVLNADFILNVKPLTFRVYTTKLNGTTPYAHNIYTSQITETFFGQRIIEFDVDLSTTQSPDDLSINQSFQMVFDCGGTGASEIVVRSGSTFQLYDFDLPELEIDDLYDVSKNMPDITAYDFVKNIARQKGFIFNTSGRTVELTTFDEIAKSKLEKKQFEPEIEVDSIISDFNPGNYFQINHVGYKSGLDEIRSATFEIENKTLTKEGDLITIEMYLPGFIEKVEIGQILSIGIFDSIRNSKIDIKEPPTFIYDVITLDLAEIPEEDLIPAYTDGNKNEIPALPISFTNDYKRAKLSENTDGHETGITPSAVIANSYRALEKVLDKFVRYTVTVRMNEQQFYGLALNKAYYVSEVKTYVYIEKISNFVSGRPTKIQMIKI